MRDRVKYIFIALALVCFSFGLYAQGRENPPQPQKQSQGNGKGPCGKVNPGGNGNSPNIPPPVGLCLPINDYLLPLFISGIIIGAYKIRSLEKLN